MTNKADHGVFYLMMLILAPALSILIFSKCSNHATSSDSLILTDSIEFRVDASFRSNTIDVSYDCEDCEEPYLTYLSSDLHKIYCFSFVEKKLVRTISLARDGPDRIVWADGIKQIDDSLFFVGDVSAGSYYRINHKGRILDIFSSRDSFIPIPPKSLYSIPLIHFDNKDIMFNVMLPWMIDPVKINQYYPLLEVDWKQKKISSLAFQFPASHWGDKIGVDEIGLVACKALNKSNIIILDAQKNSVYEISLRNKTYKSTKLAINEQIESNGVNRDIPWEEMESKIVAATHIFGMLRSSKRSGYFLVVKMGLKDVSKEVIHSEFLKPSSLKIYFLSKDFKVLASIALPRETYSAAEYFEKDGILYYARNHPKFKGQREDVLHFDGFAMSNGR